MAKFDDFDLDVTKTAAQGGIEPKSAFLDCHIRHKNR